MHSMRKLQVKGDHREKGNQPSNKDCVALVEHLITRAAEAQAVSDASPGQADLLVASSDAHHMCAIVVVLCSCPGTLNVIRVDVLSLLVDWRFLVFTLLSTHTSYGYRLRGSALACNVEPPAVAFFP